MENGEGTEENTMKQLSTELYRNRYMDESDCLRENVKLWETGAEDCRLPQRSTLSHKYSYGRALIISGCTGFSGAPVLAANACERSGAGVTRLMIPESIYPIAASRCDGAVVTPVASTEDGAISRTAAETILSALRKADACAIGPGLGLGKDAEAIVTSVIRKADCPLILDADALTICGKKMELLSECSAPLILTPHEGEFRRLAGDLSAGRLAGALQFTAAFPNVILVLKGFGTLVCSGEDVSVNPTGSPAMAKGGSGDVLSGMLCALLAQGFEPLFAARTAVYLHGLAGDLACAELGEYCVAPSDLIRHLPAAFHAVR